ncbi:alpha/beta hydrolase [Blastopirellula sp. JC732]|uniref:Alpha/beta hydrolase n=1 Tax=Blastopirellula sediminis TaxID=2894196 RepID=A0A9X1MLI6_9BACT|nr:alpha/beta hydrolase [Blastopirellula sediminis]MCC9609121.1 alpha/beta hydrolase [Blastopirellula sediminis]MCC9628102.1 alpha/beta hydrolase [Blastopirellula sediminis]
MNRWQIAAFLTLASLFFGKFVQAQPLVKVITDVVYASPGGDDLKVDLYLPEGEGPFPGVLMVHGGAWLGGDRSRMAVHALQLARNGYVVASIGYRLAPVHKFPAQLDDCRTALDWLRQHAVEYHIDPNRIAGYGFSAGAHLVCLTAMTTSDPAEGLCAVVAGGTPCDLTLEPATSIRLAYFLGGSRAEKPEVYRQASPAKFVSDKAPPMFFFHGTADDLVPLAAVKAMCADLDQAGCRTQICEIDNAGHIGSFISPQARQEAVKFLDEVLQAPAAASQ